VKKVLLITLAVVLALGVSLIGCGGETVPETGPDTVLVGLVRDLDGVLAFYDQSAAGPVYRAFTKWVNDDGGIYMSTYAEDKEIELDIRNYDPMTPGDLGTQTTALIDQDNVYFIWGAPGTTTVYTQASICNAKGIVLMTLEGGATDMISDPDKLASWPYVWINLTFSDWYQIPVLYQTLKAQGISEPKAYVCYIDNEHGHEYLEVTQEIFGEENVIAVGHDQYAATQSDMDDIVSAAKDALGDPETPTYDIFCAFTYMPYLSYLFTSFGSFGFNPPAIMMGPGANTGVFDLVFGGDLMQGISVFETANRHTEIDQTTTLPLTEMFDLVEAEPTGEYPVGYVWDVWGDPVLWAGLEMWKAAVEEVGHLDVGYSAAVREVLAGFSEEDPATTVIGDCWYYVLGDGLGGGVEDYLAQPGQIGQWQDGYPETVGFDGINTDDWAVPPTGIGGGAPTPLPKYDVTGTFIYPMTDQWAWLAA
jgi:hypothetical protein